ncbi:MAG TPA: NTP transferase domain-containing protein [Actinomycetota bacterium]|nr:NTP transferase domain-containing protein [Actinomycetota bacterium]
MTLAGTPTPHGAPMERAAPPIVRKAVVLAAGRSSRLSALARNRSKAMFRLGGLTLLQRCLRTLQTLDLDEIVVVTGHDGGAVARHARSAADGVVSIVEAADWAGGNGRSLEAAEPLVAGEDLFMVVTVDHLLPPTALWDLVGAGRPALLVDRAPTPSEHEEGTKVVLDVAGDVVDLGKELESPIIDCGAFVLPPAVFDAHRRALATGDASLAGAVATFAASQPLHAVDVAPGTWTDVDAPDDVRLARRRLRRSLGKEGDGPISRLLNRPVSTRISMVLARTPISPDAMSAVGAALGIIAAVLLASGSAVAAGVAVHATSVLDGVDGELARLRLRASPRGAMLDGILDRLVDAAVIGGLGVWAAATTDGVTVVWLVVAALTGAMLSMASKDRARLLGLGGAPERAIGWFLGGRDGRMLVIAGAAIVDAPVAGLAVVAGTSLLSVAVRTVAVMRSTASR